MGMISQVLYAAQLDSNKMKADLAEVDIRSSERIPA